MSSLSSSSGHGRKHVLMAGCGTGGAWSGSRRGTAGAAICVAGAGAEGEDRCTGSPCSVAESSSSAEAS